MIEIKGLSLNIDGKQILLDVSFKVPKGANAVLRGESGAGKTSVLRCLIGQMPFSGTIKIDEKEVAPASLAGIRQMVGYLPQNVSFFEDETVRDFILLPFGFAANRSLTPDDETIFHLMDCCSLDGSHLDGKMSKLSGGERQRIGLIRLLLLKRPVLLLDEPTSAIDEENRDAVMRLLFDDPERTILAISHDPVWTKASNPCIELDEGRVSGLEEG